MADTNNYFYFAVGPILLTIPSYLTFTIAAKDSVVNVTVTDETEVVRASEANLTVFSTDQNHTWLVETNFTKYYMFYR